MGKIDLSRNALIASIPEFMDLYAKRPIKVNKFGMGLNHSWALWYLVSKLRPNIVVESGVWRGNSTWIIENASPESQIFSFDVDLSNLVYKSSRAHYIERDFTQFDWSQIDTHNGLCFFDDHQNALQRIISANWLGFAHVIIEDNYPVGEGDCYSLKQIFAGSGAPSLQMSKSYLGSPGIRIKRRLKEKFLWTLGTRQDMLISPNTWDGNNLQRRVDTYFEMPPVNLDSISIWGTPYSGHYATTEPLAPQIQEPDLDLSYHYISYLKLIN